MVIVASLAPWVVLLVALACPVLLLTRRWTTAAKLGRGVTFAAALTVPLVVFLSLWPLSAVARAKPADRDALLREAALGLSLHMAVLSFAWLVGRGVSSAGLRKLHRTGERPEQAPNGARCGIHPERPATFICCRCGDFCCDGCAQPADAICPACRGAVESP